MWTEESDIPLRPKRKFAWSNDKKLKFNRSQVNSKSGGYRCFLLGTVSFRFALLTFGRIWLHVYTLLLPAWGRDEIRRQVDKLWKIDLDYFECNLLTNYNTLERSFDSTKYPGRSCQSLHFIYFLVHSLSECVVLNILKLFWYKSL